MKPIRKSLIAFVVCTGLGSLTALVCLNLLKPLSVNAQTATAKSEQLPKPKAATETISVSKVKADPPAVWSDIEADPGLTVLKSANKSRWVLVDDTNAVLRASEDGMSATFAAGASGRYRVLAISETVIERISMVVGNVPTPIDPPTPVDPPGPVDPVKPVSELGKKFQAAFALDTRDITVKKNNLADLKELYTQAVKMCADPAITSTGQLLDQVRSASTKLVVNGLTDLRKAVAAELGSTLGQDEVFTTELRSTAAASFAKIVVALSEVK